MKLGQWVGLFALLASVYILWQIRQILLLVFVAVVLATALNRLVRKLQQLGIKRGIAVAISIVASLSLFITFIGLVVPPFIEQIQEFIVLLPKLLVQLREWVTWIQTRIPGERVEDSQLVDLLTQQIQPFITQLFRNFFTIFSDLLGIILTVVLVVILTIMLLADPQQYRHPFRQLFPAFYRRRVDEILAECELGLVGWMTGTILTMIFIAVSSGLGLWVLQVPLVLANALYAGFLEVIPNLGPTLSVIPPLFIALLDAPWKAGAVLGLYFIIQQLESYVVTPWVMKEHVSLPPAITLLSQIVFATFFGFLGLFLALPLMIVTKIWLKELLVKDILNHWKGDAQDHQPEPEQHRVDESDSCELVRVESGNASKIDR